MNLRDLYEKVEVGCERISRTRDRRRRKRMRFNFKFISGIVIVLVFILFIYSLSGLIRVFDVYSRVMTAKEEVIVSLSVVKEGDYYRGIDFAESSRKGFVDSYDDLSRIQKECFFAQFGFLKRQIDDFLMFIKVGELLGRSVSDVSEIYLQYSEVMKRGEFGDLSEDGRRDFLEKVFEENPELNGVRANFDLGLLYLSNMEHSFVFRFFKEDIVKMKIGFMDAAKFLSEVVPLVEMTPELLGYSRPFNYLFLLRDSYVVSSVGGEMLYYGFLSVRDGVVQELYSNRFDDFEISFEKEYSQDGLGAMVSEFDFGVSSNWPVYARRIMNNYSNSTQRKVDCLISVSTDQIFSILKRCELSVGDFKISSDDFLKKIKRREDIDFSALLVDVGNCVAGMKVDELRKFIEEIGSNLNASDIVLNFQDNDIDDLVRERGWGGEIIETNSDYFMVVDSNMSITEEKVDLKKVVEYKMIQRTTGLYSQLKIMYTDEGQGEKKGVVQQIYTRVYLPLETKIEEVVGFVDYAYDIYEYDGKKIVAGILNIEAGQVVELTINYKLAGRINREVLEGEYDLIIQKQMDVNYERLLIDLSFLKEVDSYNPAGFYVKKENNNILWDVDLGSNQHYNVYLRN